ncbi:Unknown protein, partial [Striga hermonthica]
DTNSSGIPDDLNSKLKGIDLSESEVTAIELRDLDIKTSAEECEYSLFGKVIGDRKASLLGIRRTMSNIWQIKSPMEVKELKNNFFQFIFGNKEDKKKVVAGVNWIFENQYLILREWEEGLHEQHKTFTELKLWVQVNNIPLNWLCTEVGRKIGKIFNQIQNVIVVKAGGSRGSYLRILVGVDVTKPLPRCASIKLHNSVQQVTFQYERLINTCYYCGIIGHLERACEKRCKDINTGNVKEGQFGDWMKAVDSLMVSKPPSISSPTSQSSEEILKNQLLSNIPTGRSAENQTSGSNSHSQTIKVTQVENAKNVELSNAEMEEDIVTFRGSSDLMLERNDKITGEEEKIQLGVGESAMETEVLVEVPIELPEGENKRNPQEQKQSPLIRGWKRLSGKKHQLNQENDFVKSVCKKIGFKDCWKAVDPQGLSGGILLLWQKDVVIKQIVEHKFCFEVEVECMPEFPSLWLIFVYMSVDKSTREDQWDLLCRAKAKWGKYWVIGGDWNAIRAPEDKCGGRPKTVRDCAGFNEFVAKMEMQEIHCKGHQFTWANNREHEGFIEEKIDRIFCSFDWLALKSEAEVQSVFRSASDHRLLVLVDSVHQEAKRKRRFFFDKRWLKREGIKEVVTEAWEVRKEGTPMFKVSEKIKEARVALLKWSKGFRAAEIQEKQRIPEKMEVLSRMGADRDWSEWERLKVCLDKINLTEEEYWHQKSRSQWLKEGDSNTKYFHALTLQRRKSNQIHRLQGDGGEVWEDLKDIEQCICQFYQDLFTTEGSEGDTEILNLIPVNLSKSSVFFSKSTSRDMQANICGIFQGIQVQKSTRYLGLPLGIG